MVYQLPIFVSCICKFGMHLDFRLNWKHHVRSSEKNPDLQKTTLVSRTVYVAIIKSIWIYGI